MNEAAALGFRAHSGWAAVVAVAGSPAKPIVLNRYRIEIADPAIPGSKQPYHAAERLDLPLAETLICRCRDSSASLATRAIGAIVDQFAKNAAHRLIGSGILFASGRTLPEFAAILKSHALIHTAEGDFFREALCCASESCSLPVRRIKEREVWNSGAEVSHVASETLQQEIGRLGRSLGPPWTKDEKLAAMAGWVALANMR